MSTENLKHPRPQKIKLGAFTNIEPHMEYFRDRARRHEKARQGGEYRSVVVFDMPPQEVMALTSAYRKAAAEHASAKGLKKVFTGRRLRQAEAGMCQAGHREPRGNVELYEVEVESGLLEPYDPSNKYDRGILAGIIADAADAEFQTKEVA